MNKVYIHLSFYKRYFIVFWQPIVEFLIKACYFTEFNNTECWWKIIIIILLFHLLVFTTALYKWIIIARDIYEQALFSSQFCTVVVAHIFGQRSMLFIHVNKCDMPWTSILSLLRFFSFFIAKSDQCGILKHGIS